MSSQRSPCSDILCYRSLRVTHLLRLDRGGVPGDNSLALSAHGGLEAAGGRPGVEPTVVNVAQVHAHQPEAQSGVLNGCELELHLEVHSDQHVCHIS